MAGIGESLRVSPIDRYSTVRETLEEHWFSYLLVVPTFLFLLGVMWIPFLRGIWMSLHNWPFFGEPQYIGLDNYVNLFEWQAFYTSIEATIIFSTTTIVQLGIALTAALIVNQLRRFQNLASALMLIPYTMPPVATGLIWVYLMEPNFGALFQMATQWGLLEGSVSWSTDPELAITVVTLVTAWTFWPFMFLILLATLDGIPDDYYESAKMYGANRWQRFRWITLPQLRSAIIIVISLRLIWNLSKVSQPLAMTGGGPGFKTSLLSILLYRNALQSGTYGRAYTVGVMLFLLTLLFILIFLREFERQSEGRQ